VIDCLRGEPGYTVRAAEEGKDGLGYQFGAYSETSPFSALGRVRHKMYRALATRHLSVADGACRMLHDGLEGRITSNADGQVILVVDGSRSEWTKSSHCFDRMNAGRSACESSIAWNRTTWEVRSGLVWDPADRGTLADFWLHGASPSELV
jgi:hypothetical protein